jgi:anti-anti-sigma factor
MANTAAAIALDEPADDPVLLSDSPDAADGARDGPAVGLAMERFGLLAGPSAPVDRERMIEDWIASSLDFDMPAESALPNIWDRIVGRLPALRRPPKKRQRTGGAETSFSEWAHFRIAYRRGITVVRLVEPALSKEAKIRELACDLIDLVEAGNHRILLNFQAVERLVSWVSLAVDEVYRRCRSVPGGSLKICGLRTQLGDIFPIAGMGRGIEHYPDETSALEGVWPEPPGPRTLPVEILMALTTSADRLPIRDNTPSGPTLDLHPAAPAGPSNHRTARGSATVAEPGLWLIVQMGGSKGRPISVAGPTFLIGRGPECQLRLGSPMVSKLHAAIERRGGRSFLKDLGSTNGTVLNGRLLRSQEAEVHDGDRIQIGPVVATVATAAQREGGARVEEQVAEWLRPGVSTSPSEQVDALETAVIPTAGGDGAEAGPEAQIKLEILQDTLVVTPVVGELESASTIELLRAHLQALYERSAPRRVVVNLEYVAHLSGQAIGVLLAHHLRLDRSGGALRICQARARIMAVMHQVRLTMLVECHPTLDEAVLAAWPCDAKR